MGILTSIKVDSGIVNKLKVLKLSFGYTTYNDVLNELIAISYTKAKVEKISNEDIIISQKNILKRLEALHTRIGYFEKDHLLKIHDIFDAVDGAEKFTKKPTEIYSDVQRNETVIDSSMEIKYKKQIKDLEDSHSQIEEINRKMNAKVNLLEEKFVKKSGVFSQGYECNLSEQEYNEIFN